MFSVESDAIIERPVEEVWAFISDPRNEPKWHTDILEIESTASASGGPGTAWVLGSTLLVTVQFMGRKKYEVEVTGLEENRRLQLTTKGGPLKPIATYVLEPAEGGTRFTRHLDMPLEGPWRLMQPLMRRSVRGRNARFVQNLKGILERTTD